MGNKSYNPNWKPDALVEFYLFPTEKSGREKPVFSGYRPHYKVLDDLLTTTDHFFIDQEKVEPGEKVKAFVAFINPDAYPKSLWKGKVVSVQEASRVHGEATIIEVYHNQLKEER